jgi:hypothetical protein
MGRHFDAVGSPSASFGMSVTNATPHLFGKYRALLHNTYSRWSSRMKGENSASSSLKPNTESNRP